MTKYVHLSLYQNSWLSVHTEIRLKVLFALLSERTFV